MNIHNPAKTMEVIQKKKENKENEFLKTVVDDDKQANDPTETVEKISKITRNFLPK